MSRKTTQFGRTQLRAFTLLELLLVVFIMSVLAFSAVSLTETLDSSQDQFRYERARAQGEKLRSAIIDQVESRQSVSGFVADMGDLPDNMTELAFGVVDGNPNDSRFIASQSLTPKLDITPDASFYENASGDEYTLPAAMNVIKGFRGMALQTDEATPRPYFIGSYLKLDPGKSVYEGTGKPRFGDGWGNQSPSGSFTKRTSYTIPTANAFGDDEHSHGWNWVYPAGSETNLIVSAFGKDGASGGTEYSEDLVLASIDANDWSVDTSAIQVELVNDLFEVERDCSDLKSYLLVYNAKLQKWRSIPGPAFGLAPNGGATKVAFTTGVTVPAGTHVLILASTANSITTPLTLTDEIQAGVAGSTQPEIQQVLFAFDSRLIKCKLQVTLPDPDDPVNSNVTYTNDSFDLTSLTDKITELNSNFIAGGGGAGQYDSGPLEYVVSDNTIKLDAAAASSNISTNSDFAAIRVLFDPTDGNNNLIRAKQFNVLPGQTNILRINLSSLAQ